MTMGVVIAIFAIANEPVKNLQGFNGIRTHGLCVALQYSTNRAMQTHTLETGQFFVFI